MDTAIIIGLGAGVTMLAAEIDSHHATKRRLSAAKGQITKLRNARRG